MKEIKTVGIIGMGTIGVSISCILQQAGLNVIGFKHESRKGQLYKEFIEKGKIVIVNNTDNNILPRRNILKMKITSSLQEIVDKSDLILNCCRFPQNSAIYQFSEFAKSTIKKKNIPILMFPGKLGSVWMIQKENINVGLIGYSPIFARSKITPDGVTVNLLDFKSKIPLAYDNLDIRMCLLNFLNKHFRFKKEALTFIDGGSPIQTALSSPISAINVSAICDNAQKLINSKGKPIREEIYVLSEEYSQLFQKVFNEQIMVANSLQIFNLPTLKSWLLNRVKSIQPNSSITEMLEEIYKGKHVTISGQDRRITEGFYDLLFFKYFSNVLGSEVPVTEKLLSEINNLQKALNKNDFPQNINSQIQQLAILCAEHILKERKLNENNVHIAQSG
jgi:hypothetical protein